MLEHRSNNIQRRSAKLLAELLRVHGLQRHVPGVLFAIGLGKLIFIL